MPQHLQRERSYSGLDLYSLNNYANLPISLRGREQRDNGTPKNPFPQEILPRHQRYLLRPHAFPKPTCYTAGPRLQVWQVKTIPAVHVEDEFTPLRRKGSRDSGCTCTLYSLVHPLSSAGPPFNTDMRNVAWNASPFNRFR